ncbi:MAG: hypothetical protein DM484_28790 [Candidatus Methylumidiphilus alinenensis]|uniref:Uncharacterized protein n=1 Tax=Candidatus Methylumidiphilus alinenensis TaxID=2202197 RepID=A0A2W4QD34_9GAMM|nr:MAG: hypothetical protein DM484_28790 [Candidatus Methylumidiphilus alinenensis]
MNSNCEITTWDDGFDFFGKSKYFANVDIDKNGSAKCFGMVNERRAMHMMNLENSIARMSVESTIAQSFAL